MPTLNEQSRFSLRRKGAKWQDLIFKYLAIFRRNQSCYPNK